MLPARPLAGTPGGAVLTASQAMQHALASYQRGERAQAERLCQLVLEVEANNFDALYLSGIIAGQTGRAEEAARLLTKAVTINPSIADAYYNRGVALGELSRPAEAVESYGRAIARKPNYANAYNNRGLALAELTRPSEALKNYERAIALKPDYAEALYNRGDVLRDLHRHREAIDSYERALALKPDYASAHWNLADCLLLLGDFARGWQEYEWRWKLEQRENARRDFQQPLWLGGEALAGRTILLHSELGLGDTLLFCRYAKEVAGLGAKVVLEVQPPLLPMVADLEGVTQAVPRGAPLPEFDYHCPLMSLPLAFRTDLGNIPADIPYIRSDAARVAAWQAKLGKKDKPRIGVVWSGSKALRNDRRSMTLAEMLPLVGDWTEWVSLQKDVRESETALLASRADVRHLGDELEDFADTAALIELLDLLVTVDTSVTHVAGAMGKPVWILLPFNPHDWRWMLDREDSPWYPTARQFRQSANGDWASVIRQLNEELVRHFGAR